MDIDLAKFRTIVGIHSLVPDCPMYNALALSGEVGEVANNIKKRHMAIIKPEWITANLDSLPTVESFEALVKDEMGDSLFYLVAVGNFFNITLEEVMELQAKKLRDKSEQYGRIFLK